MPKPAATKTKVNAMQINTQSQVTLYVRATSTAVTATTSLSGKELAYSNKTKGRGSIKVLG